MGVEKFSGATSPAVVEVVSGAHAQAVVPVDLDGNPAAGAQSMYGAGTREHNVAALVRQAVGAASARVALPALGASREVYVMASQRAFFRTGDSTVVAASGTSHPLAMDERFYFRVPVGHTHIAVIRDSADGFITICPVA